MGEEGVGRVLGTGYVCQLTVKSKSVGLNGSYCSSRWIGLKLKGAMSATKKWWIEVIIMLVEDILP